MEQERDPKVVEEYEKRTARKEFQHHVAKFMLAAHEQAKLTQTALDMAKHSTKNSLSEYFDIVKKSLNAKLNGHMGEEFQFIRDMDELFSVEEILVAWIQNMNKKLTTRRISFNNSFYRTSFIAFISIFYSVLLLSHLI